MKTLDISKRDFRKLKPLVLPNEVSNTEAELFVYPCKDKWDKRTLIIKKLYAVYGEVFANKLYTINELIDNKAIIDIDELVMPEFLLVMDREVTGFSMPYIPNINLQTILDSKDYSAKQKIDYLKQVGLILEKVKMVRDYTKVTNFYLNDIHESNFILNKITGKINAIDLDGCQIEHSMTQPSRYLGPFSQLSLVPKYKQKMSPLGGIYQLSNDTELYCYIVMILNCFYGDKIQKLSIDEYFDYLNYLKYIGFSGELIDILSYVYSGHSNENPLEYLDEFNYHANIISKDIYEFKRKRIY